MPNSVISFFGRASRWLWWLLDASRRTLLNLLFLLLLVVLLWALLRPGTPPLQPKTALVLNLSGPVKEQRSGSPRDAALKQLQGQDDGQLQLRDLLSVLDTAAKDPKITHALLVLDDFQGGGLPTLRELAAAIERFKAAGKPVYAWGSDFDQRSYFVAAHANEVWLHPMGRVLPEGFGRYRTYYKDAFERFGLQANLLRVGQFKSAAEPFIANGPSPETLEAERLLYGALWADWTVSVEKARKLPAGQIDRLLAALPGSLTAVGGDAAKLAQDSKLVDALKTRDEMRALMIERGAVNDANNDDKADKTFRQVSFGEYLARIKPRSDGDAVGVIVAEGEISDGQAPSGRIGGQSTAGLVRKAREDDKIKALVLRVDSPGGSAFGSELVRRELELTRAAGKPVVVSMGDLAASGGYWISTAADEVIADAATITGSIGVFALLPDVHGAMDKLGLRTGGYTTSWLAGGIDPRRPLDPRMAELIQASIDKVYRDFTTLAATARKTTPERINEVAQGRVWTGQQALERGLVDRVGGYGDALASAAKRAKLEPVDGVYRVKYLDREPGRLERLLTMFGVSTDSVMARVLVAVAPGLLTADLAGQTLLPGAPAAVLQELRQDLGWMSAVAERGKPFDAVVHCLCTAP